VLAEVFSGSLIDMTQIVEQKLLVPLALPETTAYPAAMKSAIRIATDRLYYGLGWNTNLGKRGEAPTSFEDLPRPNRNARNLTAAVAPIFSDPG